MSAGNERQQRESCEKSKVKRKIHIKWAETLLSRAEPNASPTSDKPNKFFKINYRVEQTNLHIYGGAAGVWVGAWADKMVYFFLFTPQSKSRKFFESSHYPDRKMSYCTCCLGPGGWQGEGSRNEKSLEKLRPKVATLLIISRHRHWKRQRIQKRAARRCQKMVGLK